MKTMKVFLEMALWVIYPVAVVVIVVISLL
jgi:hypothetical protein